MAPSPLPSRDEIVKCLETAGKPLQAGAIGKRCGVDRRSFGPFVELLEALSTEGTLDRGSGHRFVLPHHKVGEQTWAGSFIGSPRGFGFVTAAGRPDVYVRPENISGALHGDGVTIRVLRVGPKGVEGQVTGLAERRNPRIAGVVRVRRRGAWLEPDDDRIRGPIVLRDGFDKCQDGEAAIAQITRFPESPDENPEAQLIAVLGAPGEASTEVTKIKLREQIDEEHPADAMREAEAIASRSRTLELGGRKDLREIPFLTIDPADARDHDDAVFAEKTAGGYRVYVAIADVAEYVKQGGALDREAQHRGCTIYLPDRAIPMLPGSLAADLCSLLPERERYCLCVIIDLDADARVKRAQVVEGLMRAAAMITYAGAARTLKFTDRIPLMPQAEAFKPQLRVLAAVTAKLRRARYKRGALNLDVPEAKVELNPETGTPTAITRRTEDPGIKQAYSVVEELMLLANECVARWMLKRKSPAIFRVHGTPDEEKLLRLCRIAEALGVRLDPDQLSQPSGVARWLKRIQKHERRGVLEMLLLRSLQQAVYDIVNVGHFGLASDAYLHFTSPIRRYPDLLVHRTVKFLLHGGKPDLSPAALEKAREAATQSSVRERAAVKVEREVVDLYRALFMRDRVGELVEGTIVALVGSGVYVSVAEPFVEVLVRFDGLGPDRYELSDDELSLVGMTSGERLSLGDTLVIEIEDVSILRRQVYGRRVVSSSQASVPPPRRQKRDHRRTATKARPEPRSGKQHVDSATKPRSQRRKPRTRTERTRRG